MKRVARASFVLAVMTVFVPVVVGLFGHNTGMPIGLIVASLMMTGVVIQTRSDPAYLRMP